MKQNAEEPDYRSMDEAQIKHELIKLEKRILDITGDPLNYQHYRQFLDWCWNEAKVKAVEKLMLDRCYILNLLFGCHCTPGEVERLEKVNDLLLEMTNRTYHRTADLVRALLVMKKDDWSRYSTFRTQFCVWRMTNTMAQISSVWPPSCRRRRNISLAWQMLVVIGRD